MKRKLILSRKGFDSSPQGGGGPSPILPDGSLLSLPIPSSDQIRYSELLHPQFGSYQKILRQLKLKPGKATCHLDPDLEPSLLKRHSQWRPSLGQEGAAQSHLESQNVGEGDVFLFFGWFRHTEVDGNGRLQWSHHSKQDLHVLFGYLEVDQVVYPCQQIVPDWLKSHPHAVGTRSQSESNAIYIARQKSMVFAGQAGAGVFHARRELVLTQKGKSRSWWSLPKSIFGKVSITYHKNAWRPEGFRCVGRGQEFVMPMTKPIKVWAQNKVQQGLSQSHNNMA
jgi:hypothetical protein